MSAARLLKNTILLALSEIILRGVSLLFKAYLVKKAGAECIGIYGLITSVYTLFMSVSVSGIRYCTTRLVSEQIGLKNPFPREIIKNCFLYSLIFGLAAFLLMFLSSPAAAEKWISEKETLNALYILSFSLPLISIGSVIEGYFTACQKILSMVIINGIGQGATILVTAMLSGFFSKGISAACSALSIGTLVGEAITTLLMIFHYALSVHGKKNLRKAKNIKRSIFKTAFPLAVSAYTRTGLSSLGHILVPIGLTKASFSSGSAFSIYGTIQHMAFPVIMFPASVLAALGDVIVPRLTASQINNRTKGINYMVSRSLRISILFSCAALGIMMFFSNEISITVYKTDSAAKYILLLSPLIPVIYCDSVTDGCLKGLGQQFYSMILNVIEALINVIMLWFLLPKLGIMGYIITMYVKEIFNFIFSLRRLRKISSVDIPFIFIAGVLFSFTGAGLISLYVYKGSSLIFSAALYLIFYSSLLYIFNGISRGDMLWLVSLFMPEKYKKEESALLRNHSERASIQHILL